MVQVEFWTPDDHDLYMKMLCLDASSLMMPRATLKSTLRFLRPKTSKPVACDFVAKTTKPSWSHVSTRLPPQSRHVSSLFLNRPITKSPRTCFWLGQPSSWLGQHCLHCLHMYICLSSSLSASRPWSVLWPSVPWSKPPRPSFTAPSPPTRTRLTFSITIDHLNAQHLPIARQETCCTPQLTQCLVSTH
jgi:hypothetical protein